MNFRIEIVDPVGSVNIASDILVSAWKAPSLYYSPAYLSWQFSFPGQLPNRAVLGFEDHHAAGCAAIVPRRLSHRGVTFPAYVLSFVAVKPEARGKGLSTAMYASLLDTVPSGIPVVCFAEPNSAGERLLLSAFARASFQHRPLRPCRAAGYLRPNRIQDAPISASARSTISYSEFISAFGISSNNILLNHPTGEQWAHYSADPRGRFMLVIEEGSHAVGTAMVVMTEVVSTEGLQRVPMLESVCLGNPTAHALRAVFSFAATCWADAPMVIASNLSFVDGATIRNSGARALPSVFNAHFFVRGEPINLETVSTLNLEVI